MSCPNKKIDCETNKLLKHTIKCLDLFSKMVEVQWWGRLVRDLLVWGDDEPFSMVHQEAASLTGHRVQNDRLHQSPTPWLHHWPIHHTHLQGNTVTHTSNPPPAQLRRRPLPGSGVSQVLPAPPLMTQASACAGPEWRRGRRGSSEPSDCCTVRWSLCHRRDPKKPDPRCRMGCQPAEARRQAPEVGPVLQIHTTYSPIILRLVPAQSFILINVKWKTFPADWRQL